MNTKILFTDLDGTLLNDEKQITQGNREAIKQALSAGHKIVVATGRPLSSAKKQAEKLGLIMPGCYIIAFNGACLYDSSRGEILSTRNIPAEYVEYLFREAMGQKLHIQTYDEEQVVVAKDTPEVRRYCRISDMAYHVADNLSEIFRMEPRKMLLIDYENQEPLIEFRERISEWAKGKVDCYFSSKQYLEIVPPGVSKGNAILELCGMLGVPVEDTISAGDAENDISMLQTTKVSVVMKNASESMYSYGTYITEQDNNHDGVAEAIKKFML